MKRILLLCALLSLPGLASAQRALGDYILGDTVRCPWSTYKPSTGDSVARATAGTVTVYADNGAGNGFNTVESATGVTDTSGFDGKTGMHQAVVVASSGNGYAAAKDYAIMVQGTTITDTGTVTVNAWPCTFSIENKFPLKGYILLHATEDTGAVSTTTQVELTGNVITADNQYQFNRLWDVTDGWSRAITASNAAGDWLTIYPAAPAAPTDGATLYITLDVIYPTQFFDPSTTTVVVGGFGATVGGATAFTNNAGANIKNVFDNGGSAVSTNAQIGTIATNVTGVDLLGSGTTLAANIRDALGMMAYGTCAVTSTTTTCDNAALTQADRFWSNWMMIVVQGQPPRCVRNFDAANDRLSWPQPLPSTASLQKFVLLAAAECRNPP